RTNSVLGKFHRHVVAHRALGDHDHSCRSPLAHITDHAGGGSYEVSFRQHVKGALGMGQDLYVLVLLAVETKVGGRKAFVNFAVPPPENHIDFCLSGDVTTQKLVGQENHSAAIQRLDHLHSIGRRSKCRIPLSPLPTCSHSS